MNSKELLLQIRKYDVLIQNKKEEIALLKQRAMFSVNSFGNVPVQTTRQIDRMQSQIVDYLKEEEECQKLILEYWNKRIKIIQLIEQLPPKEYDVLHKVYVQGKNLQEVADIYDRSYSWATTVSGRAMKHLQEIMMK